MVFLTEQQKYTIKVSFDIWSSGVIDRDLSKVLKIHYTWVLIDCMLSVVDAGRKYEEHEKPRDCTEWSMHLQDELYPLAWNWMINFTYYNIDSAETITTPPQPNLRIDEGINLSPDEFKSTVIRECLTHFTLEDVDSTASQYAQSVAREQARQDPSAFATPLLPKGDFADASVAHKLGSGVA